ncbi:MAG TPA: selenoneine biosynthesis selenosugar synthase SenB [Usitatibacter sp.]|jgi:putative glycosyltransferase (TIGR04348 family)|nr:selenoneine biosynthesis selenosugar synthase SenB [Usitatibacter sp.]
MASLAKPVVCIVTPGTRSANNGNWRTAVRWAGMLRDRYRPIVQSEWNGEAADVLVALHARRSAESIARFHGKANGRRMAVVLTGTDLYRDLPESVEAAHSLDLADRLVVLQDDALRLLREAWRRKAEVIFQSAPLLATRRKARARLDCVVVGHLREEKDPRTLFAAMRHLPADLPITVRHIGAPLDAALGKAAHALAQADPRYRYSGALPHGLARAALQRAHVLIHPSVVEGGANVIVEAVTAGTPVIASRISGNVGMLGENYPGLFEPRDARGLADCLVRALEDPPHLAALERACAARRALFRPQAEAAAIRRLAARLLAGR